MHCLRDALCAHDDVLTLFLTTKLSLHHILLYNVQWLILTFTMLRMVARHRIMHGAADVVAGRSVEDRASVPVH